jgi:hypothetical protein
MSSRYQSKKSNIVNKENESGPLNMIKKVQQTRREQADKKPMLKPSKSLVLRDAKFAEAPSLEEGSLAEEVALKDNKDEDRKASATRFKRSETDRVMAAYSKNFVAEMKSREHKYCPQNFLDNHKISQSVRAKMVRVC